MKATLLDLDASSGAIVAEINCVIRDYWHPESDLSGEEGVFDVVRQHGEIGNRPGSAASGGWQASTSRRGKTQAGCRYRPAYGDPLAFGQDGDIASWRMADRCHHRDAEFEGKR